jgi:thioredoxin 1
MPFIRKWFLQPAGLPGSMIPNNFFSLGVMNLQVALDAFNQELLTSDGLVLVDFGARWDLHRLRLPGGLRGSA